MEDGRGGTSRLRPGEGLNRTSRFLKSRRTRLYRFVAKPVPRASPLRLVHIKRNGYQRFRANITKPFDKSQYVKDFIVATYKRYRCEVRGQEAGYDSRQENEIDYSRVGFRCYSSAVGGCFRAVV